MRLCAGDGDVSCGGKGGNMRSLFSPVCRAKNNEEYREVLKKRRFRFGLFILAGLATEAVVLYVHYCTEIGISEYHLGFLLGLGAGMALGGVVGILKIRRRLKDEEKLKEVRLKETDERELELDSMALRGTARILLGVLYVLLILGGIFASDLLLWLSWGLIILYLLSFALFRKYYESKF